MGAHWSRLSLVGILAVTSLSMAISAQVANGYVYWANNNNGTIGRAMLDGTSVNQSFISGASFPNGIAVDSDHIYWANTGTASIARANIDGTGLQTGFISGASAPIGVAIVGNDIYWANFNGNSIGHATLNGNNAATNVDQSLISTGLPYAIAASATKIYWTSAAGDSMTRANLDGSGVEAVSVGGLNSPTGVSLNASHLFWTNGFDGIVGRADLDGSNDSTLVSGGQGIDGGAVNSSSIYWTNSANNTIGTANIDGSNPNQALISGADTPGGIALDADPGAPAFSANPASYDFGDTLVGSSIQQQFTVTNTGGADLVINSVSIQGPPNAARFSITGGTCANATLTPASACVVDVTYSPTSENGSVGTLAFADNASGSPHEVALSGTGIASPNTPTTPTTPTATATETTSSQPTGTTIETGTTTTGFSSAQPLEVPSIFTKRPGVRGCVRNPGRAFSVSYTLSVAAPVVEGVLLYKPRVERYIDSCHPGLKPSRRAEPKFKVVRSLSSSGKKGANRLTIKLRSNGQELAPGRYRVVLKARNLEGRISKSSGANFLLVIS